MAKAKTAYELLERVCEAIGAHPKAYYQDDWKTTGNGRPDALCTPDNTCTTAYCRAGWIVALHDGFDARKPRGTPRMVGWERRTREILGMPLGRGECGWMADDDASKLFEGGAVDGTPGTREYVRAGIGGLRAFMRKHKAALQERSLRGV